jgi:diphthamide biosynthesis methyltransferase
MVLFLIGLGLGDEKDITVRGMLLHIIDKQLTTSRRELLVSNGWNE